MAHEVAGRWQSIAAEHAHSDEVFREASKRLQTAEEMEKSAKAREEKAQSALTEAEGARKALREEEVKLEGVRRECREMQEHALRQ